MPEAAHDDGKVLYAPRARSQRPRRGVSVVRMCCYALALVGACVGGWLVFILGKGLYGLKQHMDFPHVDLAIKETSPNPLRILPLINASSPFAVRATVWLDVTQHLAQGGTLPPRDNGEPIPVVTYATGEGDATISEAILYSEIVANMTNWRTPEYSNIALHIPIEPLYTQDLGPSTLRITTQVEVGDSSEIGEFVFASSVFPSTSAILPRSPNSERIKYGLTDVENHEARYSNLFDAYLRASTLSDALEHTAPSTSLLSLLRSATYVNDSSLCPVDVGGNVESLTQDVPPFLDNAVSNRRFADRILLDKQGRRTLLHGKRCELLVPHVRTKASVFILALDKPMDLAGYSIRQRSKRKATSLKGCLSAAVAPQHTLYSENGNANACSQIRENGALETAFVFGPHESEGIVAKNVSAVASSFQFRYAPVLWMRSSAAGPHDHRTIPRTRPTPSTSEKIFQATNTSTLSDTKRNQNCQIPVLQPDTKNEFFDVSLQLRIASAKAMRLQMFESVYAWGQETTEAETSLDDETDVRLYGSHSSDLTWEATNVLLSDRSHPNSKPLVRFAASVSQFVFALLSLVLTVVYWYTRTTTAGMCMWAQWASAVGLLLDVSTTCYHWAFSSDPKEAGDAIGNTLGLIAAVPTLVLIAMVLLRIEVITPVVGQSWTRTRATRRPLDKAERRCRLAESRAFGWHWPVVILTLVGAYELFARPDQRVLREGFGCYEVEDVSLRRWPDTVYQVLEKSAMIGQMLFNFVSPAMLDRKVNGKVRRSNGSWAGNFKLVQYFFTMDVYVQLLVGNVKRIGGHLTRRAPVSLLQVEMLVIGTVESYQAWTFPGIPQARLDNDNDDDEDDE